MESPFWIGAVDASRALLSLSCSLLRLLGLGVWFSSEVGVGNVVGERARPLPLSIVRRGLDIGSPEFSLSDDEPADGEKAERVERAGLRAVELGSPGGVGSR